MLRVACTLAFVAVLASSCFGSEERTPDADDATPSPTATSAAKIEPVATATAEGVTPTAEPTPEATPTPTGTAEPTAEVTPTASPTPAPVPTPELPRVEVAGPLLVISERIGGEPPRRGSEDETRRVLIYDLAKDRHWAAFDYQNPRTRIGLGGHANSSMVELAGTDLVVWSGDQVRRMSLEGETQAILMEDEDIRAIKVSPDGLKVGVMTGEPGTLLVLDARDGAELLRVTAYHAGLGILRGGARHGRLDLGDWRDDGSALSITAGDHSGPRALTAMLWLDGGIRVLGEGLVVSPNLRYAVRTGEGVSGRYKNHAPWYGSLEVLDVETGRTLHTVTDETGLQASSNGFWFGPYVTLDYGGYRLLDPATGETLSLTPQIERRVEGPVRNTCGITYWYRHSACYVQHDERVAWEGASGWTHYIGLVEVPAGLKLQGVEPVSIARATAQPPVPARDEMIGPLFAYEVHGEYEYHRGEGRPDPRPTRRVIVRDEGTGRSWLAFTYRNWLAHGYGYGPGAAQPAHGGFVAEIDQRLTYVAPDAQTRTLYEYRAEAFRVSPDGRKLAATFHGGHDGPPYDGGHIIVLELAAGPILRLTAEAVASAAGLDPHKPWGLSLPPHAGANGWTPDSSAVFVALIDYSDAYEHNPPRTNLVISLDGSVQVAVPMDRSGTVAQVDPPSRATTDCPAHPAKPCDILLDGEVIGQGRWPRILGFIELD